MSRQSLPSPLSFARRLATPRASRGVARGAPLAPRRRRRKPARETTNSPPPPHPRAQSPLVPWLATRLVSAVAPRARSTPRRRRPPPLARARDAPFESERRRPPARVARRARARTHPPVVLSVVSFVARARPEPHRPRTRPPRRPARVRRASRASPPPPSSTLRPPPPSTARRRTRRSS